MCDTKSIYVWISPDIAVEVRRGNCGVVVSASNRKKQQWVGALPELKMENYVYYEKFPYFFVRKLVVNPVTLEVKWVEGLRGGGCGRSNNIVRLNPIETRPWEESKTALTDEEKKKMKEKDKYDITLLEDAFFDADKLQKLYKSNPMKNGDPFSIAKIILNKLPEQHFMSSEIYTEDGDLTIKVIRKYIYAHFQRHKTIPTITKEDQDTIIMSLEYVINHIISRNDSWNEYGLVLNLEIIKYIVMSAKNSNPAWKTIWDSISNIKTIVAALFNKDIGPLVDFLSKLAKFAIDKYEARITLYLDLIIAFELSLKTTEEKMKAAEDFIIYEKTNHYDQREIRKRFLFLDFVESQITENKYSETFLSIIAEFLEKAYKSTMRAERDKCEKVLVLLRRSPSKEILNQKGMLNSERELLETGAKVDNILSKEPILFKEDCE
jgi:hypothetical protein